MYAFCVLQGLMDLPKQFYMTIQWKGENIRKISKLLSHLCLLKLKYVYMWNNAQGTDDFVFQRYL